MKHTINIPIVPPKTTAQMQRLLVSKGRAIAVKTAKHLEGIEAMGAHIVPPEQPLSGEIALHVQIVWPYLKSDTSTKANRDRIDLIPHTSKPDLDNWIKGFQDLLVKSKVIARDEQVFSLLVSKYRGPMDRVGITATVWQGEEED